MNRDLFLSVKIRVNPWRIKSLIHTTRQEPTINVDDLAGNETRRIGSQKDCSAGEFFDVSEALHRRTHKKLAAAFGLVQQFCIERSAENARSDCIHAHSESRPLDSQRFGKRAD